VPLRENSKNGCAPRDQDARPQTGRPLQKQDAGHGSAVPLRDNSKIKMPAHKPGGRYKSKKTPGTAVPCLYGITARTAARREIKTPAHKPGGRYESKRSTDRRPPVFVIMTGSDT